MIREDQFIVVYRWMRNIPEIQNNNELLAYALIYSFSQTKGQYLICRQSYIADWLGLSRENCNRLLKRMESQGMIRKQIVKKHGAIKTYQYFAVRPNASDETSHDECCNVTRTSDETSHATSDVSSHNDNNIYNNILYTSSQGRIQNQFCNFPQRQDYNFEQLEKELLNENHLAEDGE